MSLFFKSVLGLHIGAGILALLVFWLPLVTKKGGTTHRRVGWVYVVAAGIVAVTGIVSAAHLIMRGGPALTRAGIFLSYVGVLAGASAQLGVRALRMKQTIKSTPFDLLPPLMLVAGGIALVAFGWSQGRSLYVVFAALGIAQGITHFRYWLTPPSHGREWFLAHMTAMGTSCITTVTAFVVTNAQRLGMHTFDLPLWIGPIVLFGVGLGYWRRSYARRFTSAAKAA
jgi:hypothetical protein